VEKGGYQGRVLQGNLTAQKTVKTCSTLPEKNKKDRFSYEENKDK